MSDMIEDKISIIVPVYNASQYLSECIESLINQTMRSIEIILVDDGSKDDSLRICKKYQEQDNRIKVFSQENKGVSVARNKALENVSGNYVTFVDSDDWVETDMCERILEKIKDTNSNVLLWSYFTHTKEEVKESKFLFGNSRDLTLEKDYLELKTISQYYGKTSAGGSISAGCTWGKLYDANLLRKNNIFFKPGLTRAQDTIFSLEAFECASKIYFWDKCFYHYRRNTTAVTSGTKYIQDSNKPFDLLIESYASFIQKYNKGAEFEVALNLRIIQVLLWHFKHNFFNDANKDNFSVRLRAIKKLIKQERYSSAIKEVKLSYLGKKLKLMVILLRIRAVLLFSILYKTILDDK